MGRPAYLIGMPRFVDRVHSGCSWVCVHACGLQGDIDERSRGKRFIAPHDHKFYVRLSDIMRTTDWCYLFVVWKEMFPTDVRVQQAVSGDRLW